jgi:hypothetical protein
LTFDLFLNVGRMLLPMGRLYELGLNSSKFFRTIFKRQAIYARLALGREGYPVPGVEGLGVSSSDTARRSRSRRSGDMARNGAAQLDGDLCEIDYFVAKRRSASAMANQ